MACKSEGALVQRRKALSIALFVFLILPLVMLCRVDNIFSQSGPANAALSGTVKSSEGKTLEGVGVSARNVSESFTTTVYTDQAGRYFFPPMSLGQYKMWAQAIGFELASTQIELAGGGKKQVQVILPSLNDFQKQLSGTEWAASLPEDTPDDQRMKSVFINNCSGCHEVSFLLQNRFDAAGWRKILTLMETMQSIGYATEGAIPDAVIHAYKPELAEYLGRVRGAGDRSEERRVGKRR